MRSVRDLITLSAEYLEKKNIPHPRRSAEDLLAFVLKKKRLELYFDYDIPIEDHEIDFFRSLLKRRGVSEPFEYITEEIQFFDCSLTITKDVLIPRQETEILLSKAMVAIEKEGGQNKILWDLCSGSGCLGIGAKKKCPELEVTLSDLSLEALSCAQKNIEKNKLNIQTIQGDLLAPFYGKKAHFILCNPPYISEDEYLTLDDSVKRYEPKNALISGASGYEFYCRLAHDLPSHLYPGGKVFLEIGSGQGKMISEIFNQSCWKSKYYESDWAGHDRFFFLEIH